MIAISKLSPEQDEIWNRYVKEHTGATGYHNFAWGQAIEQAYGHKPHYFIAHSNQQTVGVLPIIEMRKPLLGRELCSLPFCDLGGCLADSQDIEHQLVQYAADQLNANINSPLYIRQSGEPVLEQDLQKLQGKKVRMLLSLPESSEALMTSFKSKLRSQIRKAEKNGLTVEMGYQQHLVDDFYGVFAQNMHMLGSPVHGKGLFQALQKHYQDKMLICIVKKDTLPVGGGIVLLGSNIASIPWASTLQKYNKLAPNMLLYWSVLKEVTDRGIQQFDFGRSSYGEGTFKFKHQWGAKPILLDWQEHPQAYDQPEKNSEPGKLRGVVENIWRKLPLSLTIAIGPIVRKYISL